MKFFSKRVKTSFVASLCLYNSAPILRHGYTAHAINDLEDIVNITNSVTGYSNTTEAGPFSQQITFTSGQLDRISFNNTSDQPNDIEELSDEEDSESSDEEFTEVHTVSFPDLPEMYSTFERMRKDKLVYVDKTKYLEHFVEKTGMLYRYSRPRRFGKTILLETLKHLFQGNHTLFKGTAIYDKGNTGYGNWTKHPVIKIDFSGFNIPNTATSSLSLDDQLYDELKTISEEYGIILESRATTRINTLIRRLYTKFQQPVVVLVDEYDHLFNQQQKRSEEIAATDIIDFMDAFFRQIKTSLTEIKFALVIGCSRYWLSSLFSGPNNFKDLTFHPNYTTLLGFTKQEIEDNFNTHIEQFAQHRGPGSNSTQIMEELHHWYDGYWFYNGREKVERVFNPVSVIQSIQEQDFTTHWTSTGNIDIIVSKLYKIGTDPFENTTISKKSLKNMYNPQYPVPLDYLMLDSGYLTISSICGEEITLTLPNNEIKAYLQEKLGTYIPAKQCFFEELRDSIVTLKIELDKVNIIEAVQILNEMCFPSYRYPNDEVAVEREVTRRMLFIFGDIIPYEYCQLEEDVYPKKSRGEAKKQKKIQKKLIKTRGDLDIVVKGKYNYAIEIKCGKLNQGVKQILGYFMKHFNTIETALNNLPIHYILVLNFNKGKNTKIVDWVLIPCNNSTINITDTTASSPDLISIAKREYDKIKDEIRKNVQKKGERNADHFRYDADDNIDYNA